MAPLTSQRRLRPVVFPQPAPGRPFRAQRAAGAAFVGVIWTAAAASLAVESRTTLGKRVTSPLLSFFLGWMLRSLKLLPPMHPVYDSLASRLLPAALPLMVLSAQIRPQRSVSQDRHDFSLMLLAFSVCSFASCGGALAAFLLGRAWLDVPPSVVSKVCGCLTATYIGGSANLAEVAFDSGLAKEGGGILACLAAADVLLMCFYFAGLVLVANAYKLGKQRATSKVSRAPWDLTTSRRSFMDNVKDWLLHLPMGMLALSIPLISKILAADLHATAATSAISVALAAAIAQSGRRMSVERRRAVAKSTTYMATLFLGCFYTTLGICAGSGIGAVHIFLLSTVVLLGHLVLAFLGCELLNVACGRRIIKLPIFLVASNAAVGGPSTATTFAESLEWTELVVPAAVCGTLGYALGTPVAFALMKCFSSFT